MSGDMRYASLAMSPATPLSFTSLCQIACSAQGRAEHCPVRLRHDFAVRSEAIGCSGVHSPSSLALRWGPFHVHSQKILFLFLFSISILFLTIAQIDFFQKHRV